MIIPNWGYDHIILLACFSKTYQKIFNGCLVYACLLLGMLFCAWVGKFSPLVLSIYYSPVLKPPQMPPHRENNNDNSKNNNNLYEVIQQLATGQAQLMQIVTQFIQASANIMNNNNNMPLPPPPPQVDRLDRFLKLRPNKFSSATDPIVVEDWLHSVSKDLVTCECTDAEKIRFTAHLLEGPAVTWWETYQVTNPIEGLDLDSFREGFRNVHISTGIMN
jgi:hypothetical protein